MLEPYIGRKRSVGRLTGKQYLDLISLLTSPCLVYRWQFQEILNVVESRFLVTCDHPHLYSLRDIKWNVGGGMESPFGVSKKDEDEEHEETNTSNGDTCIERASTSLTGGMFDGDDEDAGY